MKTILLFICLNSVFAKLDKNWWKYASIYEVYIPTFKDSNGDGIGDIKGITSKLDHFTELGIDTICLSNFFKITGTLQPKTFFSYMFSNTEYLDDIIDYKDVYSQFGTLNDIEELIKDAKARGIKVLINMILNFTGNKHEWFIKSEQNIEPYSDYYIWSDPAYQRKSKKPTKPIPSLTSFNKYFNRAWTYNEKKKQFYYSSTFEQQPDLNLKNENVLRELKEIMKFWLNKGIAGFKLDNAKWYVTKLNSPWIGEQTNEKESLQVVRKMRTFLDEYNEQHGEFEKIFVVNAIEPTDIFLYSHNVYWCLGTEEYPLYHFVYYDILMYVREDLQLNGPMTNYLLQIWSSKVPENQAIAWKLDNHKLKTMGRNNIESVDILTILMSLLPGVVDIQYGQEIALISQVMKGAPISTPIMQWDDSINAGFTRNLKSFQPPVEDFPNRNVKNEKLTSISHYNLLKDLLNLRKTETIKNGNYRYKAYSLNTLVFWRALFGHPTYIVILNFETTETEVDLEKIFQQLPKTMTVETASLNAGYVKGQIIDATENSIKLVLNPNAAIVLSAINYLQ